MPLSSNESDKSDLEERLRQATERQTVRSVHAAPAQGDSSVGIAARSGIEFVAAIVVSVGIGFAADHWLHTSPIGVLVMLVLGFGAGLLNLYRTLNGIPVSVTSRSPGANSPVADDDEING